MTLVSALSGHEGIAMFADTQETVAGYSKKIVDKMDVYDLQNRPFRFAIAGASSDATYADMLQAELANSLLAVDEFSLAKIMSALTTALTVFYGAHIWPRSFPDRPQMQYLIAIQPLPSGSPEIFQIAESAATIVGTTSIDSANATSIGVGSYLADYLFNAILGGGEPLAWLCAAAVHVAREVRDNIDGVGTIDRVVLFDKWGGYDELSPIDIQAIDSNLSGLNEGIRHFCSLAMDISPTSEDVGLDDAIIRNRARCQSAASPVVF